jgi:hypothetical protein
MKTYAATLLPFLLLAGSACRKEAAPAPTPPPPTAPPAIAPAPVSISAVTLGSTVDEGKRIVVAKEVFGANDTIYASVATAGTGHAKLRALWSFVKGDRTVKVDETVMELEAVGPTVNEFHISKPGGWPQGSYRIEVFLGEGAAPAVTKVFSVS